MSEEALAGGIRGALVRSVSTRRRVQMVIEAGYDAIVWTGGLFVAVRALGALADGYLTRISFWFGSAAVCVLVAGCGLAAASASWPRPPSTGTPWIRSRLFAGSSSRSATGR